MKKMIFLAVAMFVMASTVFAQQTTSLPAEKAKNSEFALRINLPYLAVGTPFVGFEWKPSQKIGILLNGAWSDWSWNDYDRRWALWQVNPEIRYYFNHCWYMGASFEQGEFNIKLNDKGRDGHMGAGGLTGGYKARLGRALDLDLGVSFGYAQYKYDSYTRENNEDVYNEWNEKRYWWGPYQAGVTLSWKINR